VEIAFRGRQGAVRMRAVRTGAAWVGAAVGATRRLGPRSGF
jgi:hypothetical protein